MVNYVFVGLLGPRAVGKSYIATQLYEGDLIRPMQSVTTRPLREGEGQFGEIRNVSDSEFDRLLKADEVLATALPGAVVGEDPKTAPKRGFLRPTKSGIYCSPITEDGLWLMEEQEYVRTVGLGIIAPSLKILMERRRERGMPPTVPEADLEYQRRLMDGAMKRDQEGDAVLISQDDMDHEPVVYNLLDRMIRNWEDLA